MRPAVLDQIQVNRQPLTLPNVETRTYPGLYAIWFRHRCLYVGKSDQGTVYSRLRKHIGGECHNDRLRRWYRLKGKELYFTTIQIVRVDAILKLERYLIDELEPETNNDQRTQAKRREHQ